MQIENKNNNFGIPESFLDGIRDSVKAEPVKFEIIDVPIQISDIITLVSEEVAGQINRTTIKGCYDGFESDLAEYLEWLVVARIGNINGEKLAFSPKTYEVPDFFGPILASIGKFKNPIKGYELVPVTGKLTHSNLACGKKLEESRVRNIKGMFNLAGIRVSFGLPRDIFVLDDFIFRLNIVGDSVLGPDEISPSPAKVLVRVFFNIQYMEKLYGESRVEYALLSTYRGIIQNLAQQYIAPGRTVAVRTV